MKYVILYILITIGLFTYTPTMYIVASVGVLSLLAFFPAMASRGCEKVLAFGIHLFPATVVCLILIIGRDVVPQLPSLA